MYTHPYTIYSYITASGAVYSCGANSECQLGLGAEAGDSCSTPQHMGGLPEVGYKVLAGGTDHAAALTGE